MALTPDEQYYLPFFIEYLIGPKDTKKKLNDLITPDANLEYVISKIEAYANINGGLISQIYSQYKNVLQNIAEISSLSPYIGTPYPYIPGTVLSCVYSQYNHSYSIGEVIIFSATSLTLVQQAQQNCSIWGNKKIDHYATITGISGCTHYMESADASMYCQAQIQYF